MQCLQACFLVSMTLCWTNISNKNTSDFLKLQEKLRRLADSIEEEKLQKEAFEEQEVARINEERDKVRREKVQKAEQLLKTHNDERYYELRKGFMMSEVLAQREKDIEMKREFQRKCLLREAQEEQSRNAISERLEDAQIARY